MENQGSNDAYLLLGRVGGIGFRPIAMAMACGSNPRALPDLMATANAADHPKRGRVSELCGSQDCV